MILSVIIPITALIVGLNFAPFILAIMMVCFEIIFSTCLIIENKKENKKL